MKIFEEETAQHNSEKCYYLWNYSHFQSSALIVNVEQENKLFLKNADKMHFPDPWKLQTSVCKINNDMFLCPFFTFWVLSVIVHSFWVP